ncbi:hypothetical protein CERSUDRAFT_100581 [Gelatoporia subvermispora B]|uniref:DUF6534 domain-containing protein n=1 Tax=Ceriporiopsis subvermispora (strain B) TaxID=914234 RepID=M2Q359_CERS8|nr:hypothetical protein CERSUDRAFT_100581 [Gelatoporia subvermispora B]
MASPISNHSIETLVIPNCGALFLAVPFAALFHGITILQAYLYFTRYPDDRRYVRAFVGILVMLDTAQLGGLVYGTWLYLIHNFGDLAAIQQVPLGIAADIALTITLGLVSQCFFATRVWMLSRSIVIPVVVTSFSLAQFAFGMFYTVRIAQDPSISTFTAISWASTAGLACSMTADITITCSLCYYLRKIRSGVSRTDKLINVLVLYTVNTGLVTSVLAICAITVSNVTLGTNWFVIPFSLVSKCYVNTAIATLNAREKLRSMPAGLRTMTGDRTKFTSVLAGQFRIPSTVSATHPADTFSDTDAISEGDTNSPPRIVLDFQLPHMGSSTLEV